MEKKYVLAASMGQVIGAGMSTLVGVILPMIQLLRHPELTGWQQGTIAATGLTGIIVGSLLFGRLVDRYGYRLFLLLCPCLILLASLVACRGDSLLWLVAGLLVMGIGVGGEYSFDSDYVADVTPPARRSLMVGIVKASCSVGNVLMALLCVLIIAWRPSPHIWPFLLLVITGLALLTLCLRMYCPPPRGTGDARAKQLVRHPDAPVSYATLFRGENRGRFILTGVPWACEGFGVYGIGIFLPVLLMQLGLETEQAGGMPHVLYSVELTMWVNCFVLFGFVAGLLSVNRFNHYHLQSAGFLLSALGLMLLLAAHRLHWPLWVALTGFMSFNFFLNAGPHLLTFILPTQVFPKGERGMGAGAAAAMGKLGAVVSAFFIPLLLSWGGLTLVLAVCIAALLTGALVTLLWGRKIDYEP